MRDIRFRAWNKDTNEMHYTYNIHNGKGFGTLVFNFRPVMYSDNFNLMHYTGLNDKNGKMIYEDDIVEVGVQFPKKEVVFFEKGIFRTKTNALAVFNDTCLIIGNIQENPEMIK